MRETQLLLGDCLERMAEIPDGSVDMVMCDLPYGTTACKWDSVIPFEPLWTAYRRVCKKNAAIVLTAQTPFDKVLGVSNLADLKYEWLWEKNKATGHLNAKKQPLRAHENILVFYRGTPTYNPQMGEGKAYSNHHKPGDAGENYGTVKESRVVDCTTRYPRSVIRFPVDIKAEFHPTQKPVALMEYLIRTYSNEGDTILDNTFGSGTTGVACVNTNRNFVGIEREPDYFRIAEARINAAKAAIASKPTPQPDLFEP